MYFFYCMMYFLFFFFSLFLQVEIHEEQQLKHKCHLKNMVGRLASGCNVLCCYIYFVIYDLVHYLDTVTANIICIGLDKQKISA